MKKNCWEFHGCGREPGGTRVLQLGICPAAIEERLSGINGGTNAGRCCWMVDNTLFGKFHHRYHESKLATCCQCDFFIRVRKEEGSSFIWRPDFAILRAPERNPFLKDKRIA